MVLDVLYKRPSSGQSAMHCILNGLLGAGKF
jgi:hypothetical protein